MGSQPPQHTPVHSTSWPRGIDEDSVFRTLFAANPDALIVANALGTIMLANPAAASLLG